MRCGNWIRVVIVLLALLAGNAVTAQERFGGLAGTVTDASQAPVPGATITITNKQTGAHATSSAARTAAIASPISSPDATR